MDMVQPQTHCWDTDKESKRTQQGFGLVGTGRERAITDRSQGRVNG